ncbi:hypothetical protein [Streptomonospora mangrovi]|uniref:hypothetical protein n=1 Tax=Streptomonospora mangrovi TaxID=2883123 RepID=UPI002FD86D89
MIGSVVTCAWSGEVVSPAVASPRPSIMAVVARTAATSRRTSAGPPPTVPSTVSTTATWTRVMAVTGSSSPARIPASPAAVERSRLRNRFCRREASVVTVVV